MSPDKAKVFAKLVLEGQINAVLRLVRELSSGGVLPLTDDLMAQLEEKYPNPQPAKLGSLLFGPMDDASPRNTLLRDSMVIWSGKLPCERREHRDPSGIDANGFRRIMASKSFKQSSSRLCEAIATMTKILHCVHNISIQAPYQNL